MNSHRRGILHAQRSNIDSLSSSISIQIRLKISLNEKDLSLEIE